MARMTLEDWIVGKGVESGIGAIFNTMALCGMEIAVALRAAAVAGDTGALESVNVQGETQKKLDVVSNEIFLKRGAESGVLAAMVSEELDDISLVEAPHPNARYALVFDPLDGSSNLDVNGAVGSIFSVLDLGKSTGITQKDVLQAGHRQVAAGYVLYGPSTTLVLTTGKSVAMFSLDEASADFVLSADNIQIPSATNEYAINASRVNQWYEPTRHYIEDCLAGEAGQGGKRYNMRWCAAMVADMHRILCRGGIFLYPEDNETKSKGGRLRLLYEANPMSLLVEAAGGVASMGTGRILDVQPSSLHQRVGVIMGSRDEVVRACAFY
ncbi:class 1 fructose-bisphosphatase [Pelagibacterium lentulum]|uniref:Fructose-1,6-bisphosphatase class 1 n=1 Tax=Pelagibacterium lentulum TaxID=2029865 RepID=A0A916RMG4_9HYPH|nr:class 1 fructose-bisphosphatase [Pelagibacterium lentulum]GGA61636.1 fructose-1,6-bisphosphatase class 1 [Pelagibacterium lentulum]